MIVEHAETDEQIAATYEVMRQLRPHLVREDYVPAVRALMASEGFRLAALIDEGSVRAVAGYRVMTMLYGGRLLYMDDLVADETVRSRGYGGRLLGWLKDEGRRHERRTCASCPNASSNLLEVAPLRFGRRKGEASRWGVLRRRFVAGRGVRRRVGRLALNLRRSYAKLPPRHLHRA